MKKFWILISMTIFLLLTFEHVHGQSDYRLQGIFIFNFSRMIAWPEGYQNGDFVIAVFGNSPIYAEIEQISLSKKTGNQTIAVKVFNTVEEISNCHILYIPSNQSRRIEEIIADLKAKNIHALVVTDSRNGVKSGAVINFTIADNGQKYELSQNNARAMGLIPGNDIIRFSIPVD